MAYPRKYPLKYGPWYPLIVCVIAESFNVIRLHQVPGFQRVRAQLRDLSPDHARLPGIALTDARTHAMQSFVCEVRFHPWHVKHGTRRLRAYRDGDRIWCAVVGQTDPAILTWGPFAAFLLHEPWTGRNKHSIKVIMEHLTPAELVGLDEDMENTGLFTSLSVGRHGTVAL